VSKKGKVCKKREKREKRRMRYTSKGYVKKVRISAKKRKK
jgi:hypothetical protein